MISTAVMTQFEQGEVEVKELMTSTSPSHLGKEDSGVDVTNLSTPEKLFPFRQNKKREIFLISPTTIKKSQG